MCDENDQKQVDREKRYKEFFSQYDKNLDARQ